MCKGNTIITSWSWIGPYIAGPFIVAGIIATSFGLKLTWGDIVFVPFILTFFLNKKRHYCFEDSGFTMNWLICKQVIPIERIKRIDVLGTKLGTWIVVELNDAPDYTLSADCADILVYYLRHYRKSYLIPLQWGEHDKAVAMLRKYFPQEIIIIS